MYSTRDIEYCSGTSQLAGTAAPSRQGCKPDQRGLEQVFVGPSASLQPIIDALLNSIIDTAQWRETVCLIALQWTDNDWPQNPVATVCVLAIREYRNHSCPDASAI
jgi:hypothetical protein